MDNKTIQEKAQELARLIQDGKGDNIVLLDISELNSWTDYFVIATVSSSTQSQGLQKQIKDYKQENQRRRRLEFDRLGKHSHSLDVKRGQRILRFGKALARRPAFGVLVKG